jgi:hypothetical protein
MIVKTKDDVVGTKRDAHGDKWHSLRLPPWGGWDGRHLNGQHP